MCKKHTIEPTDHKHCSYNEGEVILTAKHSCGCQAKCLVCSEEQAKKTLVTVQNTECRACTDNVAYTKKTGGYLGMTK